MVLSGVTPANRSRLHSLAEVSLDQNVTSREIVRHINVMSLLG